MNEWGWVRNYVLGIFFVFLLLNYEIQSKAKEIEFTCLVSLCNSKKSFVTQISDLRENIEARNKPKILT